jgi:hypothetical protein
MNIEQLAAQFERNWSLFSKFSQAAIVTCMLVSTLLYVNPGREHSSKHLAFVATPLALPYFADTLPADDPASWRLDAWDLLPITVPAGAAAMPPVMMPVPEYLERVPYFRMVAQETRELQALLDDGKLVWPEHSKVLERIAELVDNYPSYPGVADLHERAMAILITVAADLFEQGYRFEARNLLEEALNVAPDDRRAAGLQERFSKAMREHPGSRVFEISDSVSTSG